MAASVNIVGLIVNEAVVAPEIGSLGYLGIKATNEELFDLLQVPWIHIDWYEAFIVGF